MNKKAYFFLIDSIIAVMILFVGFILISGIKPSRTTIIHNKHLSVDIMNLLADTKIKQVCRYSGGWNCDVSQDFEDPLNNGEIQNLNNTLLESIGELYSKNKFGTITPLINSLITKNNLFYQEIYGFAFLIEDDPLYNSITHNRLTLENLKDEIKINRIKTLLSTKKIIIGYYQNETSGELTFWGPYTVEIWTWMKP
jgi:hypothetical protein